DHPAGGPVERNPVAFFKNLAFHLHLAVLLVYANVAGSCHTALAHPASDHRRVARHPTTRGENPNSDFHAVNIFGRSLCSHQNHWIFAVVPSLHYRLICRKDNLSYGSAG